MGLVIQTPPGFADLANSALVANNPAFAIDLAKIYTNAVFGKERVEVFQNHYKNGDTIPLPVSAQDGYAYSRNELTYIWAVESSADLASGWMTGQDSLWYCGWLVDQTTGIVYCDEWYRRSGAHYDPVHTNDGVLRVFTIAQRQLTNLIMAAVPSYAAITAGWIAQDKAFAQQLAQAMNSDAKLSVVNREVFYLGEYYNGQTVTMPTSPADGYTYSSGECKFQFSWRWTTVGNSATFVQPLVSLGQMATMKASVNGSGVVSCSVAYVDDTGALSTYTTQGRIAVFAFCTRTGTPSGITLSGFQELPYDNFMPGEPLPFDTVTQVIVEDIYEALGTPEYFGPTTYQDGDTIPLPVSVFDPSYTYTRNELHYIYEISDTTNQTGSHLRVPIWYTDINASGFVKVNVWRLPPGGPTVDDNNTLGRIKVLVVAWRQAAPPGSIVPVGSNPSSSTSASVGTQDVPTLSGVKVDSTSNGSLSGALNGSNMAYTLSTNPSAFLGIMYNGVFKIDGFTQSGTGLTLTFAPDVGDRVDAIYFL